jgi:hypothetical protein
LTAVLLTFIALAASVKLIYSVSILVCIFFIITGIPISADVDAEILERVSIETLEPKREAKIFFPTELAKTLPVAALDNFFLASSLNLRSFLK